MQAAIRKVEFKGGLTYTGKALEEALKIFKEEAREDSAKVRGWAP